VLRFLVSPLEILGSNGVEGVKISRNRLVRAPQGELRAEATGETETLPAGLIFRSVGYKGVAIPGVPFDQRAGVIPNVGGRVLGAPGAMEFLGGVYAVGWVKRGPSGVIGTNKPDSAETVDLLLEDVANGALVPKPRGNRAAVDQLLHSRGVQIVSFADWQKLDALEQAAGRARGAPREKFTRIAEMLSALSS
jgi:ferredoxin--NADP+ reductase